MLSGDNGILQRATDAKTNTDNAQIKERIQLAYHSALTKDITGENGELTMPTLQEELNNEFTGKNVTITPSADNKEWTINVDDVEETVPAGKNKEQITVAQAKSAGTVFDAKTILIDDYKNEVVVPDRFKIADDSGTTVKDGLVIEDDDGNQYVWVPVSNINHDGSNKIKVNSLSEEGVEITLGRYTFDTSTGVPPLTDETYQYGSTYATPVALGQTPTASAAYKYYQELPTYRQSNFSSGTDGTNTTANNLASFINSVNTNKGYYIARYEASYRENGKAASKVSTATRTSSSTTLTSGMLWNFIKQGEAAVACQGLYTGKINSDLINSYAWDTAIIYIQSMGNANYANANRGSNTSLLNTGLTEDQKCKIFDLAGNESEWTTEYSTSSSGYGAIPCVTRGGKYNSSISSTCFHGDNGANISNVSFSFRSILYF